jgi:hypothetical protein
MVRNKTNIFEDGNPLYWSKYLLVNVHSQQLRRTYSVYLTSPKTELETLSLVLQIIHDSLERKILLGKLKDTQDC